ncbi:hypothetical protein, partial [Polynucleobacter kasalickyi]
MENYRQSLPPFEWLNFWEYFDIRDISKNQGDYQRRLIAAFSHLDTDELKIRLLNLLDLQLVIQLEMIFANNEYWEAQLDKATPIRFHTSKQLKLKERRIPTRAEIDAFFAPVPDDPHLKEKALRDEIESKISGHYDTLDARLEINDGMRILHSLPVRSKRLALHHKRGTKVFIKLVFSTNFFNIGNTNVPNR